MNFQATLVVVTLWTFMVDAKPYGSWRSPITSSMIVESAIKLGEIVMDGEDLYWNEMRPEEKGRSAIVRWTGEKCEDVLDRPYNARTRVHEYGGGSFTVHAGTIYFSNFKDQGFYLRNEEGEITPIITEKNKRYASPVFDEKRNFLYAVEEEHRSKQDVINRLVKIGSGVKPLHEGHDFYSMPTLHPNGTRLAFITWDHPNMPWDESTLWMGELTSDGSLINVQEIAGGNKESVFQPMWSPNGTFYYVSDRSGYWNIYREDGECCYSMKAEFGQPLWVFGMSNYGFLDDGRIVSVYTQKGSDHLGIIDPERQTLETIDLPFTNYGSFKVAGNVLYFTAASPTLHVLAKFDVKKGILERIRLSKEMEIDPGYLSLPEALEFPTENGKVAYGFYYPPKNKEFEGTDLPPLIVRSHGGPSTHAFPALNLEIQFWTTRGVAFLDVNYGGSTGYGREYRERLKGNWGIVDVDDCINGALYLAKNGRVDENRMAIKGRSAGGYTTLAALTFRDVFKAGASYYGISDLEALAHDTHKFESHYLDGLIGPYPEEKKRYVALSPIHHTDKLSCPLILFQGADDKIVLPNQAEIMFEALDKKQIPVAYILYEGEQHGFRMAKNIKKSLDSELYFYGKILGFKPSDELNPITIHNLKPK